jgi:signal transduction histidine kinase/CheY-like chemotaxis protein
MNHRLERLPASVQNKRSDQVLREVLRLSSKAPLSAIVWQTAISLATAAYFGYPDHIVAAVCWLVLIAISQTMRLRQKPFDPAQDASGLLRSLRRHQTRVLYSAAAWGSGGILLFDDSNPARQLALTVIIVSCCMGFSFSASSHSATIKMALPLLIGPIVFSLLLSPQPYMWVMGLIGSSFLVVMHRLIHERGMQLEDTLSLRMQAQEMRDDKQRFFAAASHDLRQPLQALTLYHAALAKGSENAHVVERMGECIHALDRLLSDVLDLARLDSGKVVVNVVPIHVPDVMLRVARMHDLALRDKGLRLRLRPKDLWVKSDPVWLERILSNLVSNAVRYTETGGILFSARQRGTSLWIQVYDTGIGIAPEHLDAVFGEFTQLNNPARDPKRGTGLGLAAVKSMAHMLDHPLSVRSRPGKGSSFGIWVPVCDPPAHQTPSVSDSLREATNALPPWRILVVEDNTHVQEALQTMLVGWGLKVVTADTASQAIEHLERDPFDAVLSDWRLPGEGDGLSVLRHARDHTAARLTLLFTGEHAVGETGNFPVLQKPVRPMRLRAMLTAYLDDAKPDGIAA